MNKEEKRIYDQQYYIENREKIMKYNLQWNKDNIAKGRMIRRRFAKRKRAWLDNMKIEHGCMSCGYNKCSASLEFHHVNSATKLFGIGDGFKHHTKIETLYEIRKCIILCKNCHAELHHKKIWGDIN